MKPLYLVEVSSRRGMKFFIETDRDTNSLQRILDMIRSGEIDPVKVLEIDEEASSCEDITAEVLANARADRPDDYRTPLRGEELAAWRADRSRALAMSE